MTSMLLLDIQNSERLDWVCCHNKNVSNSKTPVLKSTNKTYLKLLLDLIILHHVFDEDLFSVSFPNVSCKLVAKAIEDNQNFGYLCLFLPLPLACWQIYTHAISMLMYSSGKWLYLPATAGQLFLRFASKLVLNLSKICPPLKYSVNSLMIEEFIILLFWFHSIWRDCRKSSSLIG